MKRTFIAAQLAITTLLLTACGDMQWTKPGADALAVSQDLNDCRAVALRRASPLGTNGRSRDSQVATERSSSPVGVNPAITSNDRFIAEHEDVRVCMAQRGYTLKRAN